MVHRRDFLKKSANGIGTPVVLLLAFVLMEEISANDAAQHWAFQPVRSSPGSVDAFIDARLDEHGLSRAPEADRRMLIRRLSFDLLGLPPSRDRVRAFVASDSPNVWRKLVDEMLESQRYGERQAQHWLDVVRYADTHGFEVNTPRPNAWPYRDWVIQSFNDDKPYNRFIREQLAGDALGSGAGTGFLVAAAVLLPGQIGRDDESKRLARQDSLDEIIRGTSTTFLGLSIACARCHDHKFDPFTQRDYYSLQAFFAGVEYGDREVRDPLDPRQMAELDAKIKSLEEKIRGFEPLAFIGRTLIVDEEDASRVSILQKKNGHGGNPNGRKRGYRDDVGSATRVGNLGRGRYTFWNNVPGQDVLTYNPGVAGHFRLWISWGAHGSGVHTRDARYVLDRDGDLATRDDQRELARVDQYYPSGISTGSTETAPLWSGLLDVGRVELSERSKLIMRGGDTKTAIAADVIVLQELTNDARQANSKLPLLRAPVSPLRNVERFPPTNAKHVRFTTFATNDDNDREPCIDELEAWTAGDGAHVRSVDRVSGRDSVVIELGEAVEIDRVTWARDREGDSRDRLPVRYRIEVSLDGESWRIVATHEDREPLGTPHDSVKSLLRHTSVDANSELAGIAKALDSLRMEKRALEKSQTVYGGKFRKPDTTRVLARGNPEQPGDEVMPSFPAVFNVVRPEAASEQDRRLALANWIASPENPLSARVVVNRIWLGHFGQGLVDTPNDFGTGGSRPSHPKLLDWLAAELIRSGWSIKHVHRQILLSETYRQSSRQADSVPSRARKLDRDNRLLWRFPSRRLEGEAIRDSLLAVSGELNLEMGGPGFNFFRSRGGLTGFPPVTKFSASQMRRMIYAHKIRMEKVPIFGAFDCPDAGQTTPRRTRSTTAIQALNLFNSPFVIDRAKAFAARVRAENGIDAETDAIDRLVTSAFELSLARPPSASELRESATVVRAHDLETLCRVLFNSNEFLFLP